MSLRLASAALSVLLLGFAMSAQLPPTQRLSAEDEHEFRNELERLGSLRSSANNKPAIELQIANTYAAGGQYLKAIQRLRKVVGANLGFDPSRDPDFAKLRDTAEFRSIMDQVLRQTPPVHNSRLIATLDDLDVRPENIGFDIKRNVFLLGNTVKFELVECSRMGNCLQLVMPKAGDKGYGLGLKVNRDSTAVWTTYNTPEGASVRCYDLETGKLRRTASIKGKHVFNDLAISSTDDVYVTDTAEGSVYELPSEATTLKKIVPQHTFAAANGIAISADEILLYVSTWDDGIDAIDLRSGAVTPMIHPEDICLAFIDGLYATQRGLIAIQNGPMLPRIVEFKLGASRLQITAMRVLERRNPAFDGITTGVIADNNLYYVADPQTGKQSSDGLRPLQIFSVPVVP